MKRPFLITICALLLLLGGAAVWLNINARSSQSHVALDEGKSDLGTYPVINSLISPNYDMSFLVDTGSDMSMILPSTIEALKRRGCRVDSAFCPVIYRNNRGQICFATKRYTVDIPVYYWHLHRSDAGKVYYECDEDSTVNMVRNVNFIPSTENVNILGLDLLHMAMLEYRADQGTVTFSLEMPQGYEKLAQMRVQSHPLDILGVAHRYYLPMKVGDTDNDYFVDTALDQVQIKQPGADTIRAHSQLFDKSLLTSHGALLRGKISYKEWAQVGNRAGGSSVCYYDDGDDEYAVNPMRFTSQDMVLDFRNNLICVRPLFDITGYPAKLPDTEGAGNP